MLSPDLSSKKHVQWFYFLVRTMRAGVVYTFHIVNFVKRYSMFQYGMKPLYYAAAAPGTALAPPRCRTQVYSCSSVGTRLGSGRSGVCVVWAAVQAGAASTAAETASATILCPRIA